MLHVLLNVLVSCRRYLEQDQCLRAEQQQGAFCEVGGMTVVWGLWISAASGRGLFWNVGTWHRAVKQTPRDGALRFFQVVMFIQYMTVTRQQACFPDLFCSNGCCGRFQVSFPNQSSNLIVCNNSVRMAFHPNFYLLCVVCLQRLQEGKVHKLQFMSAMRGKANSVHPVFPSTVYHLDIPRMRIVINQCQDRRIFLDGLTKRTKCLTHCVKLSFWIYPALWQAVIEPGGELFRSSAFMLLLGNTRRAGTYMPVAFM